MSAKKVFNALLSGFILIGVGVGYLGNALCWWSNFTIFFDGWWTLFLIIPALYGIINSGFNFFNCLLLVVGISLLVPRFVGDSFRNKVWWIAISVSLVILGLYVILRPFFKRNNHKEKDGNGTVYCSESGFDDDYDVSFSERKVNYDNKEFNGAAVDVSFGSVTLDLRNAIINHDCVIKANVDFAGLKILLPPTVRFNNHCTASFGGINVGNLIQAPVGAPAIILTGDCTFGGIDVKN